MMVLTCSALSFTELSSNSNSARGAQPQGGQMTHTGAPVVVAFHLPQFHPIPEMMNGGVLGLRNGGTSQRRSHNFGDIISRTCRQILAYDLSSGVRQQQAELAMSAGVGAFAYYHYWFNGHQLLERPLTDILRAREPKFPFCVVWANENWTRRWDGGDSNILINQVYSLEDDLAHIRALRPTLTDDRYLCYDGKPILAIYRSSRLPDPSATTDVWRGEVERWGLPGLYLLRIESFRDETGDPRPLGFDAAVQFQPSWEDIPETSWKFRNAKGRFQRLSSRYSHRIVRYDDLARSAMQASLPGYPRWPGVTPGFDNSPRRERAATILLKPSPEMYRQWLLSALRKSTMISRQFGGESSGLVFVNAWNEWAEGNHLEPDQRYGRAFLEATRAAIQTLVSDPSADVREASPYG